MCAPFPAGAPAAHGLAFSILSLCSCADSLAELVLEGGEGRVNHQGHKETEGDTAEEGNIIFGLCALAFNLNII